MLLDDSQSGPVPRRRGRRVVIGVLALAAAAAVLATSCLFSTAPPKTANNAPPTSDSRVAVVTGLVQVVDRHDLHVRTMPNWSVRAIWIVHDRTGDQVPDVGWIQVINTGANGVFRASFQSGETVRVELYAMNCGVDPNDTGADIWAPAEIVDIVPGQQVHDDLAVPCDNVP
jgi:hypothetical protein